MKGYGKGKATSWARRTTTNYSQLRTNKGALQAWKFKIQKAENPDCRHCGKAAETGDHLVFSCEKWDSLRKSVRIEKEATVWKWRDWEDLDSSNWVIKERDLDGKLAVRGLDSCRIHVEDQTTPLRRFRFTQLCPFFLCCS